MVNRLGYKYTFNVKIETSNYYVVQIKGENREDDFSFIYTDTDDIILPNLTKYGYNHSGYKTEDGTVLPKEVTSILLKGHTALEAVWEAKKFNVKLYVGDTLYSTTAVAFGDSYELPVLSAVSGVTFAGWGDELLNGTFTLSEEGDIILVAHFKNQDGEQVEVEIDDIEDSKPTLRKRAWWVWVILIVLAIIGVFVMGGGFADGDAVWLGLIGIPLLALSILCMIWPSTFWWFIWWYY